MTALAEFKSHPSRVIAFGAAGVQEGVAKEVGVEIARKIEARFKNARLKSLRFVPSSKVDLSGGGKFEILANSTIQFAGGSGGEDDGRSELIDSVVTIDTSGARQKLEGVMIPSFAPR